MDFISLCWSIFVVTLLSNVTDAVECGDGWAPYKDELCIKAFPDAYLPYEDAKAFCKSGSGVTNPSLLMVKAADLQSLLDVYTNDIFDSIWLGGRYDDVTEQFLWDDGNPLEFTNFQEGYPRSGVDSSYCIELKPPKSKSSTNFASKWVDAPCQKRNMVICQSDPSWTLQDAVDEILRIRNQLGVVSEELQETQADLASTKTDLSATTTHLIATAAELTTTRTELTATTTQLTATTTLLTTTRTQLSTTQTELGKVSDKVVPVGSVYVEYYSQPSPAALWPTLSWQDISATYAGLFFRVTGGGATSWAAVQSECAPRVDQMQYGGHRKDSPYPYTINIPSNGWSDYGQSAKDYVTYGGSSSYHDYMPVRFHTQSCEIRPRNRAIRIWKRIA